MARKLRIQYAGALYHVINRGNYRRDLFETVGAAKSFLATMEEAAVRFGWQVHAYVLMRNHFHLALETPKPNLVEGMQWLQGTAANRFNRFRSENGALFQGRYQSILIEDFSNLARVVDYIHLNPVRAKVIPAEQVMSFRWSSLAAFRRQERGAWIACEQWLRAVGDWNDDTAGWKSYQRYLEGLATRPESWASRGLVDLGRGWAIGSRGWRAALAKAHASRALEVGLQARERTELLEANWESAVTAALERLKKTEGDLETKPLGAEWKLELALNLVRGFGIRINWLANRLRLGQPTSLRSRLSLRRSKNQQ